MSLIKIPTPHIIDPLRLKPRETILLRFLVTEYAKTNRMFIKL